MCGIAGVCATNGRPIDAATIEEMRKGLLNRGPDSDGVWQADGLEPTLLHTRLAILDLSAAGAQPMASDDGRLVLVYNGEIYNHREIRRELEAEGEKFRGRSDTETLLSALRLWGVARTLPRLIGMFAFGLWDRKERTLTLVRDRLGIKPLYLHHSGELLWFGSTLKAMPYALARQMKLSPEAVRGYLDCGYVPGSQSIFESVVRIAPGSWVRIDFSKEGFVQSENIWWRLDEDMQIFAGDEADLDDTLEALLRASVSDRLLADVPVGAFLSGGVDSSLVVALMQELSPKPVKTFSVSIDDPKYDEGGYAQRIAAHLGVSNETLRLGPRQAAELITEMPEVYDEPFADSSQLPMLAVSRLARATVSVCHSGDGGDELFHGYARYNFVPQFWRLASWAPPALTRAVCRLPLRPGVRRQFALATSATSFEEYFRRHEHDGDTAALLEPEFATRDWRYDRVDEIRESRRAAYLSGIDILHWLPNDILYKVDRASMAVGLEARVPILDHRIVEFARSIPDAWKASHGVTKKPLRRLLGRRVPPSLFERPKQGFGLPITKWLSSELRDWAEEMLNWTHPESPWREGAIARWRDTSPGDMSAVMWRVVMFQAWFRAFQSRL